MHIMHLQKRKTNANGMKQLTVAEVQLKSVNYFKGNRQTQNRKRWEKELERGKIDKLRKQRTRTDLEMGRSQQQK